MKVVKEMGTEPGGSFGESLEATANRRRRLFFGIWGGVLFIALVTFRAVLVPFSFAIVLAYVMAPLVRRLEKNEGERGLPRWAAVTTVYLVLVGILAAFVAVGAPRLAVEIERLAFEVPRAVNTARDEWLPELERRFRGAMSTYDASRPVGSRGAGEPGGPDVVTSAEGEAERAPSIRVVPGAPSEGGGYRLELPPRGVVLEPQGDGYRLRMARDEESDEGDITAALTAAIQGASEDTREQATTLLRGAQKAVQSFVRGVFTFFLMLMVSAYLLVTSDQILRFFRNLWEVDRRRSFDRLVRRIDRGLGGVVRGQLLIALVNGVLSGIGFWFFDLRYWPVLTLFTTVLSVIPIFGTLISSVPAILLGLEISLPTAVGVFVWIVVIHQIEGNLLNPKIMGDSAKMHPALIIFALLAGESVFGIAGTLLAVPVLSVLQSLFLHYRELSIGIRSPTPTQPGIAMAPIGADPAAKPAE